MFDYPYFKEICKTIAIDLSKQQTLYADPRAIQWINFTVNLGRAGKSIIEKAKETVWDTAQKWSFPLNISSVNMIKSTGNCGFGHIYLRDP